MTPKRVSIAAGGVALLALLAVGLVQLAGILAAAATWSGARCGRAHPRADARPPGRLARRRWPRCTPRPASSCPAGLGALRARLAALRGHPVVINKWASWCAPCRAEFGAFQRASVTQGREVAFIGIDSGDTSRADALAFLRSFPVSYPSYYDQSGQAGTRSPTRRSRR